MSIKKTLFQSFVLILFFPLLGKSQDTTFHEIGFNATPFMNQYLNLGAGSTFVSSPYIITYERRFGRFGARFGAGATISQSQENPVNDKPTEPTFHFNNTSLDLRLGCVLYKSLSKRWSLKYGMDLTYGNASSKNWTEVNDLFGGVIKTTNEDLSWNTGISPFIFAQWHITEHFSIGTELTASLKSSFTELKTTNSQFSDFDTTQKSSSTSFTIHPPTALFFIFRF